MDSMRRGSPCAAGGRLSRNFRPTNGMVPQVWPVALGFWTLKDMFEGMDKEGLSWRSTVLVPGRCGVF